MKKFKVGRKVIKLWKWVRHRTLSRPPHYRRLGGQYSQHQSKTLARICSWGRRLGDKLTRPRLPPKLSGYERLAGEHEKAEALQEVPKGHLAVYVGQKDDDQHRYLVPVIYFNHPLFGELLREAEEEFGFDHPGRITIPCRASEFESVRMKIDACAHNCRKLLAWKPRF